MVVKTIKLTSLFVNTENYRFEPLSSQKEAIDKMVEDQGDKLYSLVDDIVTNGLSPVDLMGQRIFPVGMMGKALAHIRHIE